MSKQTVVALSVVIVSVLLLGSSALLYQNADSVNKLQAYIKTNCTLSERICLSIQNALRPLSNLSFEIQRQQISKETLPSIRLYMSDGALQQIDEKRNATLGKPVPILFTGADDWVNAKLIADNGITNQEVSVSLRLKGDWGIILTTLVNYHSELIQRVVKLLWV